MDTTIRILQGTATRIDAVADDSVDLIVTSPPYPMIEMWDGVFASQDGRIGDHLAAGRGRDACELMHALLDRAWVEAYRVLKPGGIACINIGDATRNLDSDFQLYANHARILRAFQRLGCAVLPDILWRKPTNAPNKFMGSGMLPVGAYVTYEHEYILVLRKGRRRPEFERSERRARVAPRPNAQRGAPVAGPPASSHPADLTPTRPRLTPPERGATSLSPEPPALHARPRSS